MTSHRGKRCVHCRTHYFYQASGHGCGERTNDPNYCPDCKARVLEALASIPARFECRYFPVSEVPMFAHVTRAHIEEWEADLARRRETELVAQRIWPGLVNLATGDTQSIRLVIASSGPHRGTAFRVSSWRRNPDDYRIEIGLEWDIANQRAGVIWEE